MNRPATVELESQIHLTRITIQDATEKATNILEHLRRVNSGK